MIDCPEAFRVVHVSSSYNKTGNSMGIVIYSCVPDRLSVWLLNIRNRERGVKCLIS